MPNGDLGFWEMVWLALQFAWWIFLPFGLYSVFKPLWEKYIGGVYFGSMGWTLCRIKIPQNQEVNPIAMESVLMGLFGSGRTITLYEKATKGSFPDYFSLEIVSREGDVGFYFLTPKRSKDLVCKLFYSQFPEIEIVEVKEDYTKDVPATVPDENWDMWGGKYLLEKDEVYPIKTYPFFEDKYAGELIDPLSGVLEAMGSLGQGEHFWFQIQIAPAGPEWKEKGKKTIEGILKKYNMLPSTDSAEDNLMRALPHHELETVKAISNKMSKPGFSTQIIFAYIARKEVYNGIFPANMSGAMKQFESGDLNGFVLDKYYTPSTYYLQADKRKEYRKRRLLDLLRDRDRQGECPVLNVEELATIYHFPTKMMKVPSIPRLESKRAPAPPNLPFEEQ